MKLYYKCTNCKSEYNFKSKAKTRVDLAMEDGKKIQFNCEDCGIKKLVSVNDVKAKPSKMLNIIASLFFILGSLIILFYVRKYFISGNASMHLYHIISGLIAPVIIYLFLKRAESYRIKTFNKTYVNDHND